MGTGVEELKTESRDVLEMICRQKWEIGCCLLGGGSQVRDHALVVGDVDLRESTTGKGMEET